MGYKRDSDGRWHQYYDQAMGSSCGLACVCMVAEKVTNKKLGEKYVRRIIELIEGGAVSPLTSEYGGMATSGAHQWGNHGGHGSAGGGVGTSEFGRALKLFGVKHARVDPGCTRNAMALTSMGYPGIAEVGMGTTLGRKGNQGLHWIMVCGTLSNGKVLIIDPALGISEVDPADAELKYEPKPGVTGRFVKGRIIVSAPPA
jgi:hypothetical protein